MVDVDTPDQHLQTEQEDHDDVDQSGKDVNVETSMVLGSHTAVDPGTVMIESFNTPVANIAVSAAGGADHLTLWTQVVSVELFHTFKEVNRRVFLKIARVSDPGNEEEDKGKSKTRVC